jgi:hypothetical protein
LFGGKFTAENIPQKTATSDNTFLMIQKQDFDIQKYSYFWFLKRIYQVEMFTNMLYFI